jgi:YVTN family beta-propeller protein
MHQRLCLSLVSLWLLTAPAAAGPKLYVTNSAGDDVTILDAVSHKPLGHIVVGPHPHGIAAPASGEFILITIEGSKPGELVWIDPTTDTITRRMPIGPAPNQLALTPDGKIACVPCSDGYYEIIDVPAGKIVERIFTGGRPHNTLCSTDGRRFYLAPMGTPKKVTIVDVETRKVHDTIAFSSVVRPVALSRDEKRLYAEVDGLVGFEVADVQARRKIHRVQADLVEDLRKVPSRSHGIGVRPDQKELWECDVEHHEVHVYDLTADTPKQIATIPIGSQVYWLTFSPDGKTCFVSARGANAVAVIDTDTKKLTARLPAGKEPKRLLVVTPPEKDAK